MSVIEGTREEEMSSVVQEVDIETQPRCNTHRKRLKFFCSKHEMLLCSICAVKQHRQCGNVLTITEAAEDKIKQGKRFLDAYAQSITLVENAAAERKAAKKALETNVEEIQNEIHEMTEKIISVVKQEERVLMEIIKDKLHNESENLDQDIVELDKTSDNLKAKYETLDQGLKSSEISIIYAVMKERVESDKRDHIENIARRNFRDMNFRFIVSPHVNSFIRHFKSLGQVLLSDERPASPNVSSSFSSNDQMVQNTETNYNNFPRQGRMREMDKFQRENMRQLAGPNNELTVRGFPPAQNEPIHRRRNLPMRALPHPDITNHLHTNATTSPHHPRSETRREAIQRPMSTPPVASNMIQGGYQGRNYDRNPGDHTDRDYHASGARRGRTQSPYRGEPLQNGKQYNGQGGGGKGTEQTYTAVPVDRRRAQSPYRAPADRPRSPWVAHPTSPTPNNMCSVITVKEDDSGRSFAAVQISQPADTNMVPAKQPPVINKPSRRMSAGRYEHVERSLGESGRFTPTTDIDKRWIYKSSLTLVDTETKRLVSGITILGDRRILLVDQESYTVELYDTDWRFVSELKLKSRPFDILPDSPNRVVISLQSERVLMFALVTEKNIMTVAELNVPCDTVCYGVARGDEYYCVCCGEEVWVLSVDGRVIRSFKTDLHGKDLFVQAEYVAVDRTSDFLYVSDLGRNTVTAMFVEGQRLWEFSYEGFKPAGVKCMKANVYICDRDQSRVIMLNSQGQVLKQSVIGRLDHPRAISFNELGDVMLVSQMRYDGQIDTDRLVNMYSLDTC